MKSDEVHNDGQQRYAVRRQQTSSKPELSKLVTICAQVMVMHSLMQQCNETQHAAADLLQVLRAVHAHGPRSSWCSCYAAALLIGTHLYTFLLVPATMYVFYDKIEQLKEDRARSPFVMLLGLSCIMVRTRSRTYNT